MKKFGIYSSVATAAIILLVKNVACNDHDLLLLSFNIMTPGATQNEGA
jgi:hypothetical protein